MLENMWKARLNITDYDGVVVGDEHLAVDVDELGDQLPLQVSVSPQAGDGDVVHPLVSHWKPEPASQSHMQYMKKDSSSSVLSFLIL